MPSSPLSKRVRPSGLADNDTVISDRQSLIRQLQRDDRFRSYQVDLAADNVVKLHRDGVLKLLVSAETWSSPENMAPLLELGAREGTYVLCLGTEEELAQLPDHLHAPHIQLVCLPITTNAVSALLNSLHHLHLAANQAATERSEMRAISEQVKYILSISRELNGERDIPKLLSLILSKSREVTGADAGSVYVVESATDNIREGKILFKITQNHSVNQSLNETTLNVDETTLVGRAVLHGAVINTVDLYEHTGRPAQNEPSRTPWDRMTGYETHSVLTVPMFDISHRVIGVIQLINRKRHADKKLLSHDDFVAEVVPFETKDEEYASLVAQQAGIALENAVLTQEVQRVFEGFVHASVTAIEQRDPTTSGHSHRVASLTCELAREVDRVTNGPFTDVHFTRDQMKEIEYASLLHDFGKLGVRENVLVKAKKLYPWQLEILKERFNEARSACEIRFLQECVSFLQSSKADLSGPKQLRDDHLRELDSMFAVIMSANEPTVLEEGNFETLKSMAGKTFTDRAGHSRELLQPTELSALSVPRGSLTPEEFHEIQTHVTHTFNFLTKIPWGRAFANIPEIAGKHHEKLDGSGYPNGIKGSEIPIQSRMMTIVDIYDALTASDRPYKKAVPSDRALDILRDEAKRSKLDTRLLDIFIETGVYLRTIPRKK